MFYNIRNTYVLIDIIVDDPYFDPYLLNSTSHYKSYVYALTYKNVI